MPRIKTEGGVWVERELQIISIFKLYFKKFVESKETRYYEEVLQAIKPFLAENMKVGLDREIDAQKIRNVVFQLGSNEAPRPHSFNGFFLSKILACRRSKYG